jgi:hypothetical protein
VTATVRRPRLRPGPIRLDDGVLLGYLEKVLAEHAGELAADAAEVPGIAVDVAVAAYAVRDGRRLRALLARLGARVEVDSAGVVTWRLGAYGGTLLPEAESL